MVAERAVAGERAKRDRLAQRRKALGLTQEQLAERLEVGRTTVARWERGEAQPLPGLRPKLARVLKVGADRIEELLSLEGPLDGPVPVVPRQLPPAVADFTGRAAELTALEGTLDLAGAGGPGTVVISAISGMAGVGKTALAIHFAHQIAARFGDGQLYVNLRGFTPSGTPVDPEAAICGFLDALGVPPEGIPTEPEAQGNLYRSLLADKRMLIVADNARDEQQVRPLLPATPGSLVLVTSRSQLTGLAATEGAHLVSLDVLGQAEAVELLGARIGSPRAGADPEAISEIASLCGGLPLALSVAGARAVARPAFGLTALAGELRDIARRMDALDSGDPRASVRAVFSLSYRLLTPEAARMFRLLGLHPGPDISVPAAVSLAGTDEPAARRALRDLTRANLIDEHAPGRYTFHDLVRAYAAAQARDTDSSMEREAAVGRVLDHLLYTARSAAILLYPAHEPVEFTPLRPGSAPERPAGYQEAMAWFEAEHQVLLSAAAFAAEFGFDAHAWQLPWAMTPFQCLGGHWHEWAATQRTALVSAGRVRDEAAQAVSGRLLALAYSELGEHAQALGLYDDSLRLYRRLGKDFGEAKVHQNLGVLAQREGRYADALGHSERALRRCRAIVERGTVEKAAEAEALSDVGWCLALLRDYQAAGALCRQALDLNAEVRDLNLEGSVWDSLGYVEHRMGNLREATSCYQRAAGIARESGDRRNEGARFARLGDAYRDAGDLRNARDAWQQALDILDDLQRPDAGKVRLKLWLAAEHLRSRTRIDHPDTVGGGWSG